MREQSEIVYMAILEKEKKIFDNQGDRSEWSVNRSWERGMPNNTKQISDNHNFDDMFQI